MPRPSPCKKIKFQKIKRNDVILLIDVRSSLVVEQFPLADESIMDEANLESANQKIKLDDEMRKTLHRCGLGSARLGSLVLLWK